ncbi:efflux RND transporter periplasmic adaptor subunit [Aporhodopirellula aestuarii]|uniref:Efflux RND transporter periplasmic adaptor subunit n=1 Tax=Aporhodopirellula aestuarii TaxID=2950107 RepID=A0ABT0U3X9_9BACT|nr:efflux RND transporter periplasmic adaptor subunit [Aporhodopirellula aestuarii]MCM2371617.1 efflux RND transporter periplasmic adaptor subunit [Aporhodopirellula aestuarii]
MNGPPNSSDRQLQIGLFELERLRRTDSLADPVVRARGLCGEIARVADCDRVSFLAITSGEPSLVATSTTVSIDGRSREVAFLQRIAQRVREQRESVSSESPDDASLTDGPDCLEFLAVPVFSSDETTVDAVVVMQRFAPQSTGLADTIKPIESQIDAAAKAVIASWLSSSHPAASGVGSWWRRRSGLQRLAVFAMILVAWIVLLSIPVAFRLNVEGRLEPASSRGVYAPAAGTLLRLHVADGELVTAGTLLAEMSSNEIQMQYDRIVGELASAETELATLRLNQSDAGSARNVDGRENTGMQVMRNHSARQMVLRARIDSLKKQAELIRNVRESLSIRSKMDGRVMMRDDQSELVGQHVMQSQWLMQVVDTDSGYRAIVDLREKDFGYLSDMMSSTENPIVATLRLRSSPDVEFTGRTLAVADTVQIDERGMAVVEVTMGVADSLPDDLHLGATVTGILRVGHRSLGFVFFRPVIELLRSYGW